jgi:predicted component of type VI protein secretion system
MKLVIEDEAGTRSIVPFGVEPIVVGRGGEDVSFRLAERNVSRRHARFVRQSGVVFVEDLGSLNGTRVNGERITGRRRLRDGDLVQIGDYDLAVLAEEQALEPGAPPPLPAVPRADPSATTQRLPLFVEPTLAPPAPAPRVPGPPVARRRTLRLVLAVAAIVVGAGLVGAWAAGALGPVARP